MGLTEKQEKFVQEYITNGGNATAAYRVAYDAENMSEPTINVKACVQLKKDKIAIRIREHKEKIQKQFSYTVQDSFNKLNELQSLALCTDGESGRINLQSALKAEELKGKLAGLYIEKVEQTNIDTSPIEVKIVK